MTSYAKKLQERRQDALVLELALIEHFGKDAEDCDNWQELWSRGWMEFLSNASPTDTYQPKGIPRDEDGLIIGGWAHPETGLGYADEPSMYSDKFPYLLAKTLAEGTSAWVTYFMSMLDRADEVGCDQLEATVDTLTTYLRNYPLRWIQGTGRILVLDPLTDAEKLFQSWDEKKSGRGLFICHAGIAVHGRPVVPHEVAMNALSIARRQIVAKRSQRDAPAVDLLPTAPTSTTPPNEAFASLLLNYTAAQLREALQELGLVDPSGRAVSAATPGDWVGVIHGLIEAEPPRARNSKAALGRAFCETFGADLKERTAQGGLGKNGSQAEKVRDRVLAILRRG